MHRAIPHATLGEDGVGQCGHLVRRPSKDQRLEAVVVVEMHMDMGRGQRQSVVLMLKIDQPTHDSPVVMVVEIAQRCDAEASWNQARPLLAQLSADQVAKAPDRLPYCRAWISASKSSARSSSMNMVGRCITS